MEWTDYGLLADSSNPSIHTGTSYISIRLSVNGVYKYGWLKIGIIPTADTVFVYSLMIDQTTTSPSFKIGQCDNTWPTVCTTTDIGDMNTSVTNAKVYPNPATNLLFLETNGVPVVGVNIFDAAGCLLYEVKDLQTSSIDITDLSIGIYYAEVILATGSERIRFVKM